MTITQLFEAPTPRDDESGRVPDWTLGDRLAKSMKVAGMSVQGMADAFGVSRATVGRWINDKGVPSRAVMVMWAAGCGVDLAWLETGEASPEAARLHVVRHQGLEPRTRCFSASRDQVVNVPLTANRRARTLWAVAS